MEAEGWSLSSGDCHPRTLMLSASVSRLPISNKKGWREDDPGGAGFAHQFTNMGLPYGNEPSACTFPRARGPLRPWVPTQLHLTADGGRLWLRLGGSVSAQTSMKVSGQAGGTGPAPSGGGLLSIALTLSLQA